MNIIRKCKAILTIKSKSKSNRNYAISLKGRAASVLVHDLRQEKLAYAKNNK